MWHPINDKMIINGLSKEAQMEGFNYITEDGFYSKYSDRTSNVQHEPYYLDINNSVIKDLDNNCKNGDIRVKFYFKSYYPSVTILGKQSGDSIVPYDYSSEPFIITKRGTLSLDQISNDIKNIKYVLKISIISCVFTFVSLLCIGRDRFIPFRVAPTFIRSIFLSLMCISLIGLICNTIFYGINDSTNLILFITFTVSLLFIFLINKLYTYIFILNYAKNAKSKKE